MNLLKQTSKTPFFVLPSQRAYTQWRSNSNEYAKQSDPGFHTPFLTKKSQDFLDEKPIPDLEQGK